MSPASARGLVAAALAITLAAAAAACGGGGATTVSVETVTFGDTPTLPPTPTPVQLPTASASTSRALPPDVIGAAAARALVDRWNAARGQAESTGDAGPLAAVEASPALDVDTVELQLERSGQARRAGVPTIDSVIVDVPHQASYPAVVYATQRATRSGASVFEILAFTSPSAGSPWKLAWHASTPDTRTPLPAPSIGADGFGEVLNAGAQRSLVLDDATVAARLAAMLRPGAGADAVVVLNQGLPDIGATARQTVSSFSRSGGSASISFIGGSTPVVVRTTDGGAAAVVTVQYQATLHQPPGRPLVEVQSSPRYGQGLLASGAYSQIVDTYEFAFAASIPARTGGATVFLYAIGGGIVSSSGTPTTPTAPPTPTG